MIGIEVDPVLKTITIDGMRFSWEFFEMMRNPDCEALYRITRRDEDGVITFQKFL